MASQPNHSTKNLKIKRPQQPMVMVCTYCINFATHCATLHVPVAVSHDHEGVEPQGGIDADLALAGTEQGR